MSLDSEQRDMRERQRRANDSRVRGLIGARHPHACLLCGRSFKLYQDLLDHRQTTAHRLATAQRNYNEAKRKLEAIRKLAFTAEEPAS